MAEPARRLDDEENQGQVYDAPGTAPSSPRPDLKALEGGGEISDSNQAEAKESSSGEPSHEQLYEAEENTSEPQQQHDNQVGSGYHPGKPQRSRFSIRGNITKKKAALGGGVIGAIVLIIMFFLASGPLEFIHIAQLLEQFHFKSQQDQSNDRFLQEARYIRYKASGKVYRTNLGVFQNYVADRLEARLKAAGIEPSYNNSSVGVNRDGWILDPEKLSASDFTDFSGKSPAEIKQFFDENYPGVDAKLINGKIFIDESRVNSSIFGQSSFGKLSRLFLKTSKMNSITAAEGARIMSARAGSTWHPITRAKNIAIKNLVEFLKNWYSGTEKGTTEPISVEDQSKSTDPTAKDRAKTLAAEAEKQLGEGQQTAQAESGGDTGAQTKLADSLKGKLAAGSLTATALACILKGLDSSSAQIKEAQVVLPLVREGATMMAVGNQAMSGQDIDTQQLGYYKTLLDGPSTQNKDSTATTSWFDAASIQAELGKSNSGISADGTLKTINSSSPFHFLNTDGFKTALDPLCSTPGQIFQVVIGILSGGDIENTILQGIVQAIIGNKLLDDAAHWLAGSAVDPFARGADFGNAINYGSRLAANAQAITNGGRALSSKESGQLALFEASQSEQDFQSHGIAYRLFNAYDERSAISKLIDEQSPQPGQQLHNVASALLNFSHIFASIPKIFTPAAHAASAPYDYGFPQYGFSVGEMNNSTVSNPYKNADEVVNSILPAHPDYIQRIQDCFGATIDPNTYDITSFDLNPIDPTHPHPGEQNFWASPGSPDFNSSCTDTSPAWMQVRFYVFDTQTMESTACYLGDPSDTQSAQACSDIGNDQSGGYSSGSNNPSPGSYQNPFPGGWIPNRLDMGYDGTFKDKIVAPFSGTITYSGVFNGWKGSLGLIIKADSATGLPTKSLFFTEGVKPIVKTGQHVDAGTQIAVPTPSPYGNSYGTTADGSGQIEWGVSEDGPVGSQVDTYAIQLGVCSAAAKSMVLNFAKWAENTLNVAPPAQTSNAGCP